MKNPFSIYLKKLQGPEEVISQAQAFTDDQVKRFLELVDESAYALSEWMEAVLVFENWAKMAGRKISLIHQLEYLSCCAESAQGGVKLPLAVLLEEFLKTNGVES